LLASLLAPGVAAAETIDEQVALDVSLDTAGTSTIDAFDPALGTLTQVDVTITVDVLVQACVENQLETPSPATGTATGSLAVEIPTGANTTTATATATLPSDPVSGADGSADCADGLDDTNTFPAPVTALDAAYAENAGTATLTETLTGAALQAFVGTGTVTVAHTPTSDSELAVPDAWEAVAVGVGSYQVDVTYTYTPAAGAPAPTPGSPGTAGGDLSSTGTYAARALLVAAVLLIAGIAVVIIAKRRRAHPVPEAPGSS
jgi:hypothetical protein